MAIVPGKGITLWKALLRERILSDGMVYCHPISQGRHYFKAHHATHKGVVIHDALCPKTGHRVQT